MVEDLIIRPYNLSDQENWLKCRLISFHDSAYYDDVYTAKPTFKNLSLELVAEISDPICSPLAKRSNMSGSKPLHIITLVPEDGEAYYWRGQAHSILGNSAQSAKDIEKSKELGYEP